MHKHLRLSFGLLCGLSWVAASTAASTGDGPVNQVPTTEEDFFQPGTQPGMLPDDPFGIEPFQPVTDCAACHGDFGQPNDPPDGEGDDEPFDAWIASMMAQAARDPVWQAAVDIANQDAAGSGEFCIRCHSPNAWLAGRSSGGNLDNLLEGTDDFHGVSCHFCHRLVNPTYVEGESPAEDEAILADLEFGFDQPGPGRYVIDPIDSRRGPFDDIEVNPHGQAQIIPSPFHRESELCASCHDVSTPTYMRQSDGTYVLTPLNEPHPTQNPNEMFPEQRTYSEWLNSQFANGGVVFPDGRFGGNLTAALPNVVPVVSCQDCHMQDVFAGACFFWETPPFFARPDMPKHAFNGANTWVLQAVYDLYGEQIEGLDETKVQASVDRAVASLQAASDVEVTQIDDLMNVRVTNFTGHKLPTGYPEGRRMWINVKFLDAAEEVLAEHGAYDLGTAELDADSTKVYQTEQVIDEAVAKATGLPAGTHFHLALNNVVAFDNRIPPMGFTNAAFEAAGAAPVGVAYADGQHWDDTAYDIPACAAAAEVTVYYQTTSKEYIEFLRDNNQDPSPANRGQVAYDAWVAQGKSAPVVMDNMSIKLAPVTAPDTDGNGVVDVTDLINVITNWGPCDGASCLGDTNCDGVVDVTDLVAVIVAWG